MTKTVCISGRKVKKKDGKLYVHEVIQNVMEVMNVMLLNVKIQIKWRSLTWEQNHTNISEKDPTVGRNQPTRLSVYQPEQW